MLRWAGDFIFRSYTHAQWTQYGHIVYFTTVSVPLLTWSNPICYFDCYNWFSERFVMSFYCVAFVSFAQFIGITLVTPLQTDFRWFSGISRRSRWYCCVWAFLCPYACECMRVRVWVNTNRSRELFISLMMLRSIAYESSTCINTSSSKQKVSPGLMTRLNAYRIACAPLVV